MREEVSFEVAFTLEGHAADGTRDDGPNLLVAQDVFAHRLPSVSHEPALEGERERGSEGGRVGEERGRELWVIE